MGNILSIFGILCVCFGIVLNISNVSGTTFEEMLQSSGVLETPSVSLPQTQLAVQPERQPKRNPVTQSEKPLSNVGKKCSSLGMFCVPRSMCSDGYILENPTNSRGTHNRNQAVECSRDKVCCSIPPMTEICTGAGNYCVAKETCKNGEIDAGETEIINLRANVQRENKCNVTEVCCKLVKKEQYGENCTGPPKYCVPKATCINGNIDTTAGPIINAFSLANPKCGQNELCCQYGGQDVKGQAKYGEFSWVVQILEKMYNELSFEYSYLCVGSLVAPNVVLTVAHRIDSLNETDLLVRAGEWDTRITTEPEPHADRNVKTMIVHESFHGRSMNFDIAILILEKAFELGPLINTIGLPSEAMSFDNSRCIVAGWGKKQKTDKEFSPILKKINATVVHRETCQEQLSESLNFRFFELQSSFICAGGDIENPCKGDGGAPLMCPVVGATNHYELAGVLAFSSECNKRDVPGVYVNVPLVRSWISEKTNLT